MPRIKAYRYGKSVIPVDRASIATVFECPWTGRIFSRKRDYVDHLGDLRTNRMHKRIRDKARDGKLEDLWNQPTFDDIVGWINRNPEFMLENALRHGHWSRGRDANEIRETYWLRITYLTLDWSDRVSNTHSCPHDGVTNWGGRELFNDGSAKPRGYPGWSGRIEYNMSHDIGFGSDPMRNLRIHTGSGGGNSKNRFGYEVKFFESDWPGLRQGMIFDRLSEGNANKKYVYGSPRYFR